MLKIQEIKKGDIFYECGHNASVKLKAVSDPKRVITKSGDIQWNIKAKYGKRTINLMQTMGLEHYGPQLYWERAYEVSSKLRPKRKIE